LLKVLAISKAVVSDDPGSFCTLLITFVCFIPLLSISLIVDHNFLVSSPRGVPRPEKNVFLSRN